MPWPDLHHRAGTGQFRPRSPTVMCRFDWPTRVRTETPSSGCALRLGSTDSLRRFVRETCQIAIGQFGDAACAAGSMNVATRLTRLGCARSARPRAFLSVAGVLARHSRAESDQSYCPLVAPCRRIDENSRGKIQNVRADSWALPDAENRGTSMTEREVVAFVEARRSAQALVASDHLTPVPADFDHLPVDRGVHEGVHVSWPQTDSSR